MKKKYIIGLDQSTSGTKIVLVDEKGQIVYKKTKSHKQYYPENGWVEHDPNEIYANCLELLRALLVYADGFKEQLQGISITNQRETIIFWDSVTKEPLYNAIVWQCRRSTKICQTMVENNLADMVMEKTGLTLDPYFSASKIKWALEHVDKVAKSAEAGTLRMGTVDSWLIYKLTGGEKHLTDHTNASRTMLYNISTHDWDDTLLELFGVKRVMLPSIQSCDAVFGRITIEELGISLPISGVIGDSQGALFGQQCFEVGMSKVTYGTGSSILMFIGDEQIRSKKGIVTSIAWGINGKIQYVLEGIINSSGDTLKWVKDNLGLYSDELEVDSFIQSIESNEGVYIVPAFVGLGAPYWKPSAKAAIIGLSRKSNKAHIIRAAVESMAYQVVDLLDLIEVESGKKLGVLNVDGGPTNNGFLMQLQADLLQTTIQCAIYQELSVLGAVYLGGLGLGVWKDREELKLLKRNSTVYNPQKDVQYVKEMMEAWHEAVKRVVD